LHYWAFKNSPRAFINEKIVFTFDKKPVAQSVILKIEEPGKGEGEYKYWHKVYWHPRHFQKVGAVADQPNVLYHLSRRTNRGSIKSKGLVPQIKEYKDIPREPGVFFFQTREQALDYGWYFAQWINQAVDVYECRIPEEYDIERDPHPEMNFTDAWKSKQVLAPENVKFLQTILVPTSKTEPPLKSTKVGDHTNEEGFWAGEGNAASGILPVNPQTGNVCLAWRSQYVQSPNCWGTIGGAVQQGLSPSQSAKAELAEETGYSGGINLIPAFTFSSGGGFQYHNFIGVTSTEFSFAPKPYSEEEIADLMERLDEDQMYQLEPGWETDYIQWVPYAEVVADMKKHSSHYHPGLIKLFSHSRKLIEKALGIKPEVKPEKQASGLAPVRFTAPTDRNLKDYELVTVDTAKLDHEWSKDNLYIAPGDTRNQIGDRYARFTQWRLDNPDTPVEASIVSWSEAAGGEVHFTNGRHRFCVLRDQGYPKVQVMVPKDQAEFFRTKMAKTAAQTLAQYLKLCSHNIARHAQQVYDAWDQNETGEDEEYGGGGICDAISEQIIDIVLSAQPFPLNATEGGQEGDDHSWVVVYTDTEVYGVDIPHNLYERGGGYSWQKVPGVQFEASDVEIWKLDIDPAEFNANIQGSWIKKAAGFAFRSFKKLWHVGSMNPNDKRDDSYEGAGLSVSVNPDEWQQIARIGGDLWELTKAGNRFVNFHRITAGQKKAILQWGIQNGLAESAELWRYSYTTESEYGDEPEQRYGLYDSEAKAREQLGGYSEGPEGYDPAVEGVEKVEGGVKATAKLSQRTHRNNIDPSEVYDLVVTVYAEDMLDCDGVWWADTLDPASLSAPRGVIFPSKLSGWTQKKVQQSALEPDQIDNPDAEFEKIYTFMNELGWKGRNPWYPEKYPWFAVRLFSNGWKFTKQNLAEGGREEMINVGETLIELKAALSKYDLQSLRSEVTPKTINASADEPGLLWRAPEDNGRHDYQPSWDYEPRSEQNPELAAMAIQCAKAEYQRTKQPFELHDIDLSHLGAVAMYIDGTCGYPVVLIDLEAHRDHADQIGKSINHELKHAIQDAEKREYDEEEAEAD
jgi:ADP-ribose pyrophosphatase YjhB (NUDIX family)